MNEEPARMAHAATSAAPDEFARLSALEQEVVRKLRRLDFPVGQERIVVIRWNGVRIMVLPTQQA